MNVVRIVILVLLALLLITTGGGKLAGAASSHVIRDSLRVAPRMWKAIGVFEMALVVALIAGIWSIPVGMVGTLGVVVLMIGAIATRLRASGAEQRAGIAADVVVLVAGLAGTALALAVR